MRCGGNGDERGGGVEGGMMRCGGREDEVWREAERGVEGMRMRGGSVEGGRLREVWRARG